MLRQRQTKSLIRVATVPCAVLLAAACATLAGAATAQAAPASPYSPVTSKVSGAAAAKARAYWTPARLRHAKSADGLAPRGRSDAAAPAGSAVHSVAPYRAAAGTVTVSPDASGSAPSEAPVIGKVFFSNSGGNYACSASSVNSDSGELVLTAGHCVYDVSSGQWASNFVFIPGYDNGAEPYGEWSGSVLTTFSGFTAGDETLDTGFVAVSGPSKLRDTVGALGLETGYSSFAGDLFTMGYPAQSPNWQYYCQAAGSIESDSMLHMPCDQQPGASGSPIIDGFDWSSGLGSAVSDLTLLISYSDGSTENAGPLFTDNTWNLYESIQGVTV
jgi:V8-like Glu-specific endopeptidase